MYICKNCGQTYTTPSSFCGRCGGEVTETPDTAYTSYDNPAPAYSYAATAPAAEAPAGKGPAIVGMIFGILATILAFVCIFIGTEAIDEASYYSSNYYYYDYFYYSPSYYIDTIRETALVSLFVMSLFVLPCMIVGLATSFRKSGLKVMSIVGRVTSFVSLALLVISFIMVFSI